MYKSLYAKMYAQGIVGITFIFGDIVGNASI